MNKCFIFGLVIMFASACVHEFPVIDHSFEFTGAVVYDQETDQHRLTLTCEGEPVLVCLRIVDDLAREVE